MTPLVSIIVPIYNAEKNLDRCIESILNQTYREFELLLLDDGSGDSSGGICDRYAALDERIRVIHKANSGVSDTRNQGIALARGEYIQFLDSDDWITSDATGLFLRAAQESGCDMVIADFYRVIGERVSTKGAIEEDGLMDRRTYAVNMMQNPADFYYGVLWNKFYKRSIIEKYQLKMDSAVSWCEDFMFNLEYIRHVDSVYALNVPVYYYVKTKGSLVSQSSSMKNMIQMKRKVFAYYNDFYKDVFDEVDYEKRRIQVYRFLIDVAGDGEIMPGLSGSLKLGEERTNVSEGVQEGEGPLYELFRERKLQEKMLDTVMLRNELSINEVKLLYYLSQPHEKCTFKEMADIVNTTRGGLSLAIQRLLSRELIEAKEKEKGKSSSERYVVTSEADNILSELLFVMSDYDQIQYEGFSEEEIVLYERLKAKRDENIRRALR